jgi:hypothetical protein
MAVLDQPTVNIRHLNWFALLDKQLWRLSDAEILAVLNNRSPPAAAAAPPQAIQEQQHTVRPSQQPGPPEPQQQWNWTAADLQLLAATDVWLAADVVYDELITDAFMRSSHQLMLWQQQRRQQQQQEEMMHQQKPGNTADTAPQSVMAGSSTKSARLLVALEKRFNFTLRDMDARASAFEHFMTYVAPAGSAVTSNHQGQLASAQQEQGAGSWQYSRVASSIQGRASRKQQPLFMGRQLDMAAIPQVGGLHCGPCELKAALSACSAGMYGRHLLLLLLLLLHLVVSACASSGSTDCFHHNQAASHL